ncbi:MAG: dihydrodipicolinate synthase family protein [Bacteroidetes bacterium]|nr:MAG: dihydrodipicolinate synthase family protein [Bacteroidota bacterium]
MKLPLKGIIPPMITPMTSYKKLDDQGISNLIEHLISGGVHGLFILGTNGEAPSLSYDMRKELIRKTCTQVNGRIPVLVGITDTSIAGSIELSEYSANVGADAVVVAPPYYFPVSQAEMADYFEALVPKLALPFVVYNMPSHTKIHLSLETVNLAMEMGSLGIKDSSGDIFYLYTLLDKFKNIPDFSIITGTELFIPETIMNGGHGAVAGGANIFPKLFVQLYEASLIKDHEAIAGLRSKVMELYNSIYNVGKYTSRITKGTKCALSVMGICNDYMAPPLHRFNPAERKQIEHILNEFNF